MSSATKLCSSLNSATLASILRRLKSLIGNPSTTSACLPPSRTGNDEISPASIPYWPAEMHPTLNQSPEGVGFVKVTTLPIAAFAAEAPAEQPPILIPPAPPAGPRGRTAVL